MSLAYSGRMFPAKTAGEKPEMHYENVKTGGKDIYENVKNKVSRSLPHVSLLTGGGRTPREKACKTGLSGAVPAFRRDLNEKLARFLL